MGPILNETQSRQRRTETAKLKKRLNKLFIIMNKVNNFELMKTILIPAEIFK